MPSLHIVAYLSLATNEHDTDSFKHICNKGILYIQKKQRDWAIKNCNTKHISIFDAVDEQMQYVKRCYKDHAEVFRETMHRISKSTPSNAIAILCNYGYSNYLEENNFDVGAVTLLYILAKQEPNITSFLNRLKELEIRMKQGFNPNKDSYIILCTIHSSKGLEYDTVYMVDVYDGRFPSSIPNAFNRSKDNADAAQEERRLFYVGITRAKNRLHLFSIEGKESSFIKQLKL